MNADPREPSELVNRLRQQLILAQVRIMELEDVRDSLLPRVAEFEQLLKSAQTIADGRLEAVTHLENVLSDTQGRCTELDRLLQLAGQQLAAVSLALTDAQSRLLAQDATILKLKSDLQDTVNSLASTRAKITTLEADIVAITSTRSWRWTAWLRTIGSKFAR